MVSLLIPAVVYRPVRAAEPLLVPGEGCPQDRAVGFLLVRVAVYRLAHGVVSPPVQVAACPQAHVAVFPLVRVAACLPALAADCIPGLARLPIEVIGLPSMS